jgi:hypothetical protein
VETASNPAGAGRPASSAQTAVVISGPSCTIRAKSAKVLLPPTTKNPHKRKTSRKPGTVSFVIRCDQDAHVTLQGKLHEVVKPKHGRMRTKTFALPMGHGSAHARAALTLTLNLPRKALAALRSGGPESVTVILTATNVNGTSTTSATVRKLKPAGT